MAPTRIIWHGNSVSLTRLGKDESCLLRAHAQVLAAPGLCVSPSLRSKSLLGALSPRIATLNIEEAELVIADSNLHHAPPLYRHLCLSTSPSLLPHLAVDLLKFSVR